MTLRPGPTLLRLAGAMAALGFLSFAWPPLAWLLPLMLAAGIGMAAADLRVLFSQRGALRIDRRAPACVGRNRSFSVGLHLENSGPRPLQGEIREVFPPTAIPPTRQADFHLAAGATEDLAYSLRLPRRGRYRIGPAWYRLQGPFRAMEWGRAIPETSEVKVLPESLVGQEDLHRSLSDEQRFLDKEVRTRIRGEGSEFESIDRYHRGDDIRRIDWRSSAKHNRLMVRRYQIEQHRDVMLAVDTGRLMGAETETGTKLDHAVNAALMVGRTALEKGDRCGIGVFDDRVRGYLPPQMGTRMHHILVDCLYDVRSEMRETNFGSMFAMLQSRQRKRGLVIVLSDIVDSETTERFRGALATLARCHVVVFAALRTPLLEHMIGESVESSLDVSRKAVVFRLLRDRERALHALHRGGVHVLDVAPKELTLPLLNKYLDLRERNLV